MFEILWIFYKIPVSALNLICLKGIWTTEWEILTNKWEMWHQGGQKKKKKEYEGKEIATLMSLPFYSSRTCLVVILGWWN